MQQQTVARRVALIKEIPLFAGLSEKDLVTIVTDLRLKEYGKNDLIFRQGDESRELYIVLKGKVRIYKISPSGDETSIDIFSTADVFGELAAMDSEPRNAAAQAVGVVSLLLMPQERFLYHLRTLPGLAFNLARLLGQKLRCSTTSPAMVKRSSRASAIWSTWR
jgi:CRP-like cAMP-binding protein